VRARVAGRTHFCAKTKTKRLACAFLHEDTPNVGSYRAVRYFIMSAWVELECSSVTYRGDACARMRALQIVLVVTAAPGLCGVTIQVNRELAASCVVETRHPN
jgi:hypothetical protein